MDLLNITHTFFAEPGPSSQTFYIYGTRHKMHYITINECRHV